MKPIFPFGFPFGLSGTFWGLIGLIRYIWEKMYLKKKQSERIVSKFTSSDIAVLVPAHNEEVGIRTTIKALKHSVDPKQIYVVSDGSTDKTYRRAQMEKCHVSYLNPGRGKARGLVYLLKYHRVYEKYKLICIVDADTRVDKNFINRALKYFNDPKTAALFATTKIIWPHHTIPRIKNYYISYRDRLNCFLLYFFIYGQTWKYTNVNYVIPGFCTIYRSNVLKKLEIDTPGLLIEDFNLAFQLHRKKLGKIVYDTTLIGWNHYPDNLKDYWNQVRRWNIGFFQTVRKNGFWPSFFWGSMAVFFIEVLINSIFYAVLPFIFILWILQNYYNIQFVFADITGFFNTTYILPHLNIATLFIGIFLLDYIFTVIISLIHKRPIYLFYGLFFFFMHFVTSLILLSSLIPGFFSSSSGQWTSPTRRSTVA